MDQVEVRLVQDTDGTIVREIWKGTVLLGYCRREGRQWKAISFGAVRTSFHPDLLSAAKWIYEEALP